MKILGDVISPFVRMCLVSAHEVGLKDKVSLMAASVKPMTANAELTKLSAIGKIPVLVTDHAHPVHDSRVIMEYLAHVGGSRSFIPDDGVKRFRVLTLQALAIGMSDAAVALRYEQAQRPETARWPELMARLQQRIGDGLDEVESQWLDVLGDVSAATVSLACVLDYIDLRHGALNWREGRPKTATFAAAFGRRDSMQAWPLK